MGKINKEMKGKLSNHLILSPVLLLKYKFLEKWDMRENLTLSG